MDQSDVRLNSTFTFRLKSIWLF